MAKPRSKQHDAPRSGKSTGRASGGSRQNPGEMRVDAPHVGSEASESDARLREALPVAEALLGEVARQPSGGGQYAEPSSMAQQLRTQALQLADHLCARQKELDHRESELNARVAEIDAGLRQARLWVGQRQAELDEGQAALEARRAEFEAGEQARKAVEGELAQRAKAAEDELACREECVRQKEAAIQALAEQVEAERRQLETQHETAQEMGRKLLAGLERRVAEREALLDQRQSQLDQRQTQLDQAEVLLVQSREEVEAMRLELTEECRKANEEIEAQRQRIAAEDRREQAELEHKWLTVRRHSEQIDHSRAAVVQLREELGRTQRETLEMRIATEELWSQITGSESAGDAARSLEQLRARLADHYRTANADLANQKQELQTLRSELAEQHRRLSEQKQVLERWAAQQSDEVRRQSDALAERQRDLELREEELLAVRGAPRGPHSPARHSRTQSA
jgi:hypothetical protein